MGRGLVIPKDHPEVAAEVSDPRLRVALERVRVERARRFNPVTRAAKEIIIAAITAGMTIDQACDAAGVAIRTAYRHRDKDERFREDWDLAMEASCAPLERRMESIFLEGDMSSMATVRAGETLLKGRSRRYHPPQPSRQSGEMTLTRGDESLSFRIQTPGID